MLRCLVAVSCLFALGFTKILDCDKEMQHDAGFAKCCQKNDDGDWFLEWPSSASPQEWDEKCKCTEFISIDNIVNYWDIHFCQARHSLPANYWQTIMVIAWSPLVLLLFSLIASTADSFFVPTLEELSNVMRLSPSVAGATLIALANGAPDLICSIAGMSGTKQPKLITGAMIGGAMLTGIFIFGVVIFVAPYQSKRRVFLRDALFLLFTMTLFGVVIHCEHIHWISGWVMFTIYAMYVLLVIFNKPIIKKLPTIARELFPQSGLFQSRYRKHSLVINSRKHSVNSASVTSKVQQTSDQNQNEVVRELDITSDEDGDEPTASEKEVPMVTLQKTALKNGEATSSAIINIPPLSPTEENEVNEEAKETQVDTVNTDDVAYFDCANMANSMISYFKYVVEWSEQSIFGKMIIVLESPLTLLRIITIPKLPEDEGMYHDGLMVVSLICAVPLIIFAFNQSFLVPFTMFKHVPVYLGASVFGIFSYLFLLSRDNVQPQNRFIRGFILFVSMICCASWIMLFANELLSLLNVIGMTIGMEDKAIGYTFLAIGNSLPDLMVNVTTAKTGEQQSAITACFEGTIFNTLCSYGVAVVFSGFDGMHVNGGFEGGFQYTATYSFLMIGLLFIVIKSMVSNYYLGKVTGAVAIVWYIIFLASVIGLCGRVPWL